MKKDKEQISAYIKLVYSQDSPLNHIENLKDRKIKAAGKAGFEKDDELIAEIMEMRVESINKQIFKFLKDNNSNRYIKLCSDQQLYYRMMEKILLAQDSDDDDALSKANKISKESDELLQRITRAYIEIFKGEEKVVMIAEKTIKMITPEERLKKATA